MSGTACSTVAPLYRGENGHATFARGRALKAPPVKVEGRPSGPAFVRAATLSAGIRPGRVRNGQTLIESLAGRLYLYHRRSASIDNGMDRPLICAASERGERMRGAGRSPVLVYSGVWFERPIRVSLTALPGWVKRR